MPTITHIFKTYFPDTQGGLEEAIRQIGKYSLQRGFEVNVVSVSDNPKVSVLDGIKCTSFKRSFGPDSMPISIDLARSFKDIIDKSDIIQLHYPYPVGDLLTLLNGVKKPIVITFHCEILNRPLIRFFYEPFARMILNKVKVIVPTSENLLKSTPLLKQYKDKSKVINLWLDEGRFSNLIDVEEEFKLKVDNFSDFALFVGVLRWYKGIDVLLDAAKKISGNVVVVGKGPLMEHLKDRINDEKINNVFLMGFMTDSQVSYLMKKCKFTVLPSISPAEAFGQVLLESCFYSKAMISTELGTGTSYVNFNSETGFVVKPSSSDELANAMDKLFSDTDLCDRMGVNAHKRYKENFTVDVQGEKYIDIYNYLLSK